MLDTISSLRETISSLQKAAVTRLRIAKQKSPRLFYSTLVAVGLLITIAITQPQQFNVAIFKIALALLGGIAGYWFDRDVSPYARPDTFLPEAIDDIDDLDASHDAEVIQAKIGYTYGLDLLAAASMIRRAIIVAAFVLGVTLGL